MFAKGFVISPYIKYFDTTQLSATGYCKLMLAVMTLITILKQESDFFITGIVKREPWKDYLLSIGGLEDGVGNVAN